MQELVNIYLIGFMGAGKSTVAPKLAEELSMDWVDVDDMIEERAGFSIREIFDYYGERRFRELEKEVIREVSEGPPVVISVGGGAPMDSVNWSRMSSTGIIIYLEVGPEEAYNRIGSDGSRPLLADLGEDECRAKIKRLLLERHPVYQRADIQVKCNSTESRKVIRQIVERLPHDLLRLGDGSVE